MKRHSKRYVADDGSVFVATATALLHIDDRGKLWIFEFNGRTRKAYPALNLISATNFQEVEMAEWFEGHGFKVSFVDEPWVADPEEVQ